MNMGRILEDVIRKNSANTDRITAENTIGYVVAENSTGVVAESSFDNTSAQAIVKHMHGVLVAAAQSMVRDLDPPNKLCYMRVATRKFEYLIAPEEVFTITVLQ
ncbi:dynein light chain roadblock-type 1 [Scaptodrosophila lebanonensis]|uniref:Dynein light chain roadblock-type 1 n=1 Tax=Drosophila lebanonensis TaxID=7225 RepID=A0A6J2U2T2_DROLE|nr:dynein light chain roadblock-type 1 [Scaptodrosophila lebanonensis]